MNQTVEEIDLNAEMTEAPVVANRATTLPHTIARWLVAPATLVVAWMIYQIVSDYFRLMELMDSLPGYTFS